MTTDTREPSQPCPWVQGAVFAAVVATLLPLALVAVYHCDEMNAMRHVGMFAEGDFAIPGRPGLLWLLLVPLIWLSDPKVIMLAARVLSVLAAGASAVLLVRLASRDAVLRGGAAAGGVIAAVFLFSSPNFMAHAFEIRTDTFVLPLQLALLLLWLREDPRKGRWWIAGLVVGAILLFSQKSVYFTAALHLAVVVHALIVRREGLLWSQVRALLLMDALALGMVVAWYGLMTLLNGGSGEFVAENLRAAASTAFTATPLSRKARGLWHAALAAPVLYAAFLAALTVAFVRPKRRPVTCALGALTLGLLCTIFVHRGFFHYYIASLEPFYALGAALLCGLAWDSRRWWARALVLASLAGVLIWGGLRWNLYRQVHNDYQESVMASVQEIGGGEKVRVFDGIGLAPGYPQPGFFMTRGAREEFRRRHPEDGLILLWRDPPVHVFVYDYMTRRKYLTRNEREYVSSHYLPYRDNVRLLGWRGEVGGKAGGEARTLAADIVAEGDYTVWFHGGYNGAARLDDKDLAHRERVHLTAGTHEITADAGRGELWLLWGIDRVPDEEPVDWSMFPILNRQRYQHYRKAGDLKTPRDDPSVARRKKKREKKKR